MNHKQIKQNAEENPVAAAKCLGTFWPSIALHEDCGHMGLDHLQRTMERIHQFNFEPPARQEEHARVMGWAEAITAEGLSLCFALSETKAEQELRRTSQVLRGIGQYLVSHYIVRENESMLRRASRTTFALKGRVKVTFSLFQGRKYIASVSNGHEQHPGNSSELFALDSGETAHVIHIAENHLGVVNLLQTSKGREVFLGFVGAIPDHDWELASTPAISNYRSYYESLSSMWIGGLAFEYPSPVTQGVPPFDPTTILPPMPDFRYCVEPFFFSSANLQCLSEITVCQIPDIRGISGLLLTYTNGHKEALGEVRLNCLEPPIDVGKQDRIWLRFEYDPTGIIDENPRLVEISFSRIEPTIRDGADPAIAGLNRLEVLSTDELHWWWSSLQCQVFYEGQGRLQPRDAEKWLLFDD
ncbi:hypothetical protein FBULB1_4047 [Fusarium bulbicola]|nr:hypothetical protein FBULB1_4047 [Fusarium bulbicola]